MRVRLLVGAALVIALVVWWRLQAPPPAMTADATSATMPAAKVTGAALAPASAPSGSTRAWTQSEQDRVWCRQPPLALLMNRPVTPELFQKAKAVHAAMEQADAETKRQRARWMAELRHQGDERSQAAADVLDASDAAKRHLFDLARNTRDPMVYGWAMGACVQDTACELSAQRWAQLDPGNLVPWMMEARQAKQRGDVQAQREAVYQIGLAKRSDDYARALLDMEFALAQADRPGLQMSIEVMQPFSEWTARKTSSYLLIDYCSVAGVKADPSRQPVCLTAADAMWRHADDLMGAMIAAGSGQRLAGANDPVWSQRKAELKMLEKRAAENSSQLTRPAQESDDACAGLPATREYLAIVSAIGELAALRQLPDTSAQ